MTLAGLVVVLLASAGRCAAEPAETPRRGGGGIIPSERRALSRYPFRRSSGGLDNDGQVARAAFASPSIPPPPPLSVPVWSLAAPLSDTSRDGVPLEEGQNPPSERRTSMNIVTFATPVSAAPPKLWVVSLYANTLTRRAFLDSGVGVLQLLTPEQKGLVPILGKRSGYEAGFSKRDACAVHEGGKFAWVSGGATGKGESESPEVDVIPGCAAYVRLKLWSITDAGDHDVALCEVTGTCIWDEESERVASADSEAACAPKDADTVLYTGLLRAEGII